jgi:ATP-binding cassette subfamily F protein 3
LGGIYDFLQKKKLESLKELEQKSKPAVAAEVKKEAVPVVEANKLSYEERKEINKQISRLEKSIEQTENDIARLEDEVAAMDEKMANPANLGDPSIFESYDQLKQNLEQVMDQWSEYTGEYEELLKQKNW